MTILVAITPMVMAVVRGINTNTPAARERTQCNIDSKMKMFFDLAAGSFLHLADADLGLCPDFLLGRGRPRSSKMR